MYRRWQLTGYFLTNDDSSSSIWSSYKRIPHINHPFFNFVPTKQLSEGHVSFFLKSVTNLRPTFFVDHVVLDGHGVFLLLLLTNRGCLGHGSLTLLDLPVEAHHVLVNMKTWSKVVAFAACWLLMENKMEYRNEDANNIIRLRIFLSSSILLLSFCWSQPSQTLHLKQLMVSQPSPLAPFQATGWSSSASQSEPRFLLWPLVLVNDCSLCYLKFIAPPRKSYKESMFAKKWHESWSGSRHVSSHVCFWKCH